MSLLAGCWYFDERPVEPLRDAIVAGLDGKSPDGVSLFTAPGLVIARSGRDTWCRESRGHPVSLPSGRIVSFQGRVDNYLDVHQRLASGEVSPHDAPLAGAAFDRWGPEGLSALIGDWTLIVWDPARRVLHMACDYMAVRPLYYAADANGVAWSSDLGELVTRTGREDDVSEEFVARFMTLHLSGQVTPYVGIQGLAAGSCASIGADGRQTHTRFWRPQPGAIRFRDPRDYEVRLRELWREAVGTRLQTTCPVWAELSGGYDSSSVVCMADLLIRARQVPASAMHLVSHVALQQHEGDERRFIEEVERQTGARSTIVGIEEHMDESDPALAWVTPFAASGVALAAIRLVRSHGGKVILTGRAGDGVMGCSIDNSIAVLDDVRRGHLLTAGGKLRAWSRASRKPFIELAAGLARGAFASRIGIVPIVSPSQRSAARLLTPSLREYLGLDRTSAALLADVPPEKRQLTSSLLSYALGGRLGVPWLARSIVRAHPFLHRPLVEFVLSIPGDQLSAPGEPRSLMRRAFDGMVPPRILRRISKGYYPPVVLRALRPHAERMRPVDDLHVARRGWIEPRVLDEHIGALLAGGSATGGEVQSVHWLEQWLAQREERRAAATPRRKEVTRHEVLDA